MRETAAAKKERRPAPAVASAPPAAEVAAPVVRRKAPASTFLPPPPELHVLRTTWHPKAERRSAKVEVEGMKEPVELREGDAVGILVVSRIEPSAVVFLHGGTELRRSVGKRR